MPYFLATRQHRSGSLSKDGPRSLKKNTLASLIMEKKTYGGSITIIRELVSIQDIESVGKNMGLLHEFSIEESETTLLRHNLLELQKDILEQKRMNGEHLKINVEQQKLNVAQAS